MKKYANWLCVGFLVVWALVGLYCVPAAYRHAGKLDGNIMLTFFLVSMGAFTIPLWVKGEKK